MRGSNVVSVALIGYSSILSDGVDDGEELFVVEAAQGDDIGAEGVFSGAQGEQRPQIASIHVAEDDLIARD